MRNPKTGQRLKADLDSLNQLTPPKIYLTLSPAPTSDLCLYRLTQMQQEWCVLSALA